MMETTDCTELMKCKNCDGLIQVFGQWRGVCKYDRPVDLEGHCSLWVQRKGRNLLK